MARQTASGSGRGSGQVLAASPPRGQSPCGSRPSESSQVSWRPVRGAMMRRLSSSSNSSVEARERVSVGVGSSGLRVRRRSSVTVSWGPPAPEDRVDGSRCPGEFVLQDGVGAGAGLAHAVPGGHSRTRVDPAASDVAGTVSPGERQRFQ